MNGAEHNVKGIVGPMACDSTQLVRCGTEKVRSAPSVSVGEKEPSLIVSKWNWYFPLRKAAFIDTREGKFSL